MNYLAWNNLLGKYFFNPSCNGKEVFLYTSKSIILEIFKSSGHYNEFVRSLSDEIEEEAVLKQDQIDQEIWEDYCKALRIGSQYNNNQLKTWFEKVEDCWQHWEVRKQHTLYGETIDYPLYLGYLIAMIIPLTENEDDFSANNYYDRVVVFFKDNHFFTKKEVVEFDKNYDSFRNIFSNHFRDIEYCWQGLAKWSISQHNGTWGIFKVKIIGGFNHVGKPFAECVITRHQRQLIPLLFEKGDLEVGGNISENSFTALLARHGQQLLRYPAGKWSAITSNNSLTILLSGIVKETYRGWNGIVRPQYEKEKTVEADQSVFNLYLSVFIDQAGATLSGFGFRFFQPEPADEYDDMEFVYQQHRINELSFYHNGWAKNKTSLPETIEKTLDQRIIYRDSLNRLKAIHNPSTVYLFSTQAALSGFTSKSTLDYTGEYYLLYKNTVKQLVETWLESCTIHKTLNHFKNIPSGWLFCSFSGATMSCPGIPMISVPATVMLDKVQGMKIDVGTYLNFWSVRFLISGLKGSDQLYAVAEDAVKTALVRADDGWYEVHPSDYTNWQKFKIETSSGIPLGSWYRFQDCLLPHQWQEPALDQFGFAKPQGQEFIPVRGLHITQLPDTYPIAHSQLYYSSLAADKFLAPVTGEYAFNDILLYAISNRSSFDLAWFATAFEHCAKDAGMQTFGSKDVKNTLYLYHQLGFINYDYLKDQRKHWVSLNRPTFLNLPMKVAASHHFQVLLTGARTPAFMESLLDYCKVTAGIYIEFSENEAVGNCTGNFLPQVVTLKARSREIFLTAGTELNIDYQPDIYYPLSLVKHAPSIHDFQKLLPSLVLRDWQDCTMTKTVVDIETLKPINTTNDIDTALNLVEYYPGTYQAVCILWQDNVAYEIDKNWGKYYLLYHTGQRQILRYNVATSELFVPVTFGLPKIFARALCLMSGRAPGFVEQNGQWFQVYRIPSQLEWNILNNKLNQRNHI